MTTPCRGGGARRPRVAAATACVAGRVLTSAGAPFTGANVVAWNLDDAADALSWVSGAALVDAGAYTICGLRPGARYRIEVQEIDARFAGGSRVGRFSTPAILPGPPESWNGAGESSDPALDPPASFEVAQVAAGTTRSGVDLRLNRQAFAVLNPTWGLGETPIDFAVGDFDGDGRQDFVGVQFGFDPGNIITFSRGRGDGTFDPPVQVDEFNGNESVVAGQFNAALDSHLDVAVASESTGEVRVYFGNGHGGFGPPQTLVAGQVIDGISSKLATAHLRPRGGEPRRRRRPGPRPLRPRAGRAADQLHPLLDHAAARRWQRRLRAGAPLQSGGGDPARDHPPGLRPRRAHRRRLRRLVLRVAGAKIHLGLGNGAGGVGEVLAVWGLAEFPAGSPGEMDAGDFDGDGKLDLLLSDGSASSFFGIADFVPRLSVLLQRELGGEVGPCIPGDQTLCLAAGRFRVEATWTTAQGSGPAHAVPLTADTGYLWFFAPSNVEVVVKVLDACLFNQRFWVFAGGLTDVAVELRVTDSQTGQRRTYRNPLGAPYQPLQDTGAFATCP